MRFVVDTTGVAKGFRDYRSAVDGILGSLDKFEAKVESTMSAVRRSVSDTKKINQLKRSIKALGDTKVNAALARDLNKLSASFKSFKAPSAAAVRNTRNFFKVFAGMPDLTAAARNANAIKRLGAGMSGFTAPTKAQSEKLVAFAKAVERSQRGFKSLSSIRGISGIANELASISIAMRNLKMPTSAQAKNLNAFALALNKMKTSHLGGADRLAQTMRAISGFKAPSAAQIRNLSNFVDAIGKMRVPKNANELAEALVKIARAANSASQSTRRLRGGLGGVNSGLRRTAGRARSARVEMMGLQNAFSATFQIGSALRSLFGALTVAELARNFSDAANAGERLKSQMAVISTEAGFANSQLAFVNKTADQLGIDSTTAAQGFGRLSVAAHQSGISVMQTRDIFTGFGTAMTVLGTTTERQNDVLLAMQQVMNKGYLSAEELNQQLNEHLPGSMGIAAEYAAKLGYTLEEGLKKKVIDAEGVLAYMAETFRERYGPALEEAMKRPDVQMTRLRSNIKTLFQLIGQAGANQGLAELFREIADSISPEKVEEYAKAWGRSLYEALNNTREAFIWIRDNWDSIEGPLFKGAKLLGQWMVISGLFQIGRFLVQPLLAASTVIGPLLPKMRDLLAASQALAATNLVGYYTQLSKISSPSVVTGVTRLSNAMAALNATSAGRGLLRVGGGIAKIGGAAKNAAPMVARLVGLIGTGFSIAWFAASQAADESLTKQVSLNYTATEIMRGAWHRMTNWIAELWEWGTDWIGQRMKELGELIGIENLSIGKIFAHTFIGAAFVVSRFTSAAWRTLEGFFNSVAGGIGDLADAFEKLFTGDFAGAISAASGALSGKRWVDGFAEAFEGFHVDYAKFNEDLARSFAGEGGILSFLNQLGYEGRVLTSLDQMEGPRPDSNYTMMSDEELRKLTGLERPPREDEDDGTSGGDGRAGRRDRFGLTEFDRELQQFARMFDQINPVQAEFREGMDNLLRQGQLLLTDSGFEKFFVNVREGMKAGELSVESLIAQLESGEGIDQRFLTGLAERYNMSVEQIIANLRGQQVAFRRATREAMNDAIDFQTGEMLMLGDAFGQDLPGLSQLIDSLDEIRTRAAAVLNDRAYGAFIAEISSGGFTAADALNLLNESMEEQANLSNALVRQLEQQGFATEDLARANERLAAIKERDLALTKRSLKFGADQLATLREEIALAAMSMEDRRVAEVLRDAYQQNPNASREDLATLDAQTRALFRQADAVQRLNDLYENNGIRGYINDINQAGMAAAELDRNVLQSLEDQLFNLGKTGQFSFNAIFETIHEGMLRFASQGIVRHLMEGVFGGREGLEQGNPSLFGGVMEGIFGDSMGAEPEPLGTRAKPIFAHILNAPPGLNMQTGEWDIERGRMVSMEGIVAGDDRFRFTELKSSVDALTVSTDDLNGTNEEFLGSLFDQIGQSAAQNPIAQSGADVMEQPGVETAVADATKMTTQSFADSMVGMMPLIGMSFASSFKSPIAQVAAMFATMMLQKMAMNAMGGAGVFAGIFAEGGVSTNPVARAMVPASAFRGAPSYASGTPFAGGGMPAVLHPNEAVIPLSRNRKVPVEMNGNGGGQVINNNFHVTTPDADSFRKSRQQLSTDLHMAARRSFMRNRG